MRRAAVVFVVLLLVGCGGSTSKVYEREAFEKQFLGKTLTEVRAKLGAPDQVNPPQAVWIYHRRTRDSSTGKIDKEVRLQCLPQGSERVTWIGCYAD